MFRISVKERKKDLALPLIERMIHFVREIVEDNGLDTKTVNPHFVIFERHINEEAMEDHCMFPIFQGLEDKDPDTAWGVAVHEALYSKDAEDAHGFLLVACVNNTDIEEDDDFLILCTYEKATDELLYYQVSLDLKRYKLLEGEDNTPPWFAYHDFSRPLTVH